MEIIEDISAISKVLNEKIDPEQPESLSLYALEKSNPKFKYNTIMKVSNGNGNVMFDTVLKLCNHLGYDLVLQKQTKRDKK